MFQRDGLGGEQKGYGVRVTEAQKEWASHNCEAPSNQDSNNKVGKKCVRMKTKG